MPGSRTLAPVASPSRPAAVVRLQVVEKVAEFGRHRRGWRGSIGPGGEWGGVGRVRPDRQVGLRPEAPVL